MKTVVRYRLIFRDGSHGAWDTDLKRIQESAEFFQARIEKWVVEKTVVRYRLIFRDGSHGAWETDLKRIQESAEFFQARIEKWVVELP